MAVSFGATSEEKPPSKLPADTSSLLREMEQTFPVPQIQTPESLAGEDARLRFAFDSGRHAVVEWVRSGFLPSKPEEE